MVYVPPLPASIPELKFVTYYEQFGTNSIIVSIFVESQRVHIYRAPVRYVTKTWNVVLLNEKNTYTAVSSVLCMTSC